MVPSYELSLVTYSFKEANIVRSVHLTPTNYTSILIFPSSMLVCLHRLVMEMRSGVNGYIAQDAEFSARISLIRPLCVR